jgi:glycerophosphoryl diester phosphodiesterase
MKRVLKVIGILLGCLVLAVGLVYLVSFALARPIKQHPFYAATPSEHKPLILAHQGGEFEYPSNTKLAFTKAHEVGSDVLDGDIFATKDGVLVLFHDETLEHRTNGTGYLRDKTLAELQQVDFAYKWSPDYGATYPYRGQGITVFTLEELFKTFPDSRFGIEIKQTTTQAVETFCALIKQYDLESKVLVSSPWQPNMDTFRRICPEVATSATEAEVRSFYKFNFVGLVGLYRPKFSSLQVPEKQGKTTILNKRFIGGAHKRGLKIYAWTIDTTEQAERLTNLGVDGLNTSYPKRLIEWLSTR